MPTAQIGAMVVLGLQVGTVNPALDPSRSVDNTAALQSFLNTVPDNSTIDFGSGTYRLDGTITLTNRVGLTLQNGSFWTDYLDPTAAFTAQQYYALNDAGTWPRNQYRTRTQFVLNYCDSCIITNVNWRGPNPVENLIGQPASQIDALGQPGRDAYQSNLEAQHFLNFLGGSGHTVAGCTGSDFFGDFATFQPGPLTRNGVTQTLDQQVASTMLVTDCVIYNSGRMGISLVHAQDITLRRLTMYNMRRSTIDLEPTVDTQWVRRVEIDRLSYGSHPAFYIVSANASHYIDDVNIHDCSDNTFGTQNSAYPSRQFSINAVGARDPVTFESNKHRWTFRNNTCSESMLGLTNTPMLIQDIDTVTVGNNVFNDGGGGQSGCRLWTCTNVTDEGGNNTTPLAVPFHYNWLVPTLAELPAPVAVQVTVGTGNRRNRYDWPYAPTSVWNTSIGSSATLVASGLSAGQTTGLELVQLVIADPADPLVNVYPAQPSGAGYCGATVVPLWDNYTDPYALHDPCAVYVGDMRTHANGQTSGSGPPPWSLSPIPPRVAATAGIGVRALDIYDGYTVQPLDRFFMRSRHNGNDSSGIYIATPSPSTFSWDFTQITPADTCFDGAYYLGSAVYVTNGATFGKSAWVATSFLGIDSHAGDNTNYWWGSAATLIFGTNRTIVTFDQWNPTLIGVSSGTVRLPSSLLIPDKEPFNGPDYHNYLNVTTSASSVNQYVHAARCAPSSVLYATAGPAGDITTDGLTGARSSGLPSLGGALTLTDVSTVLPIRHVLSVNLPVGVLSSTASGWRWPASAAVPGGFAGTNPDLRIGSLLAIPSSVVIGDLAIASALGAKLFFALQNYGAYVADTGSGYRLSAHRDAHQWTHDNLGDITTTGDVHDDINKLLAACQVVTNNTAGSIGGGGTPLQPAADPLG